MTAVVIIVVGAGNSIRNQPDHGGSDQSCTWIHDLSGTPLYVISGCTTARETKKERCEDGVVEEPVHDPFSDGDRSP